MHFWQLAEYFKIPEISCVYLITHQVSGRKYIGRTSNLRSRARSHWSELVSGRHKNPKFIHTFEKHGPAFVIRPLVIGSSDYCTLIEGKLLADIDLNEFLNCHRSSSGGGLGMKFSDATKKRLSELRKGRPFTDKMKAAQKVSRENSDAWKAHQDWMKTPEAVIGRCLKAATPEAREKAIKTRKENGHKPFSEESRQKQRDAARERLFLALDWAVANKETRYSALKKFSCSWGSLKKYQSEWEAVNGLLNLPKRASGEKNARFKHGLSGEVRRKRTEEELAEKHRRHSERMLGKNNPMYGRKHTDRAKAIQSASAKEQARRYKEPQTVQEHKEE